MFFVLDFFTGWAQVVYRWSVSTTYHCLQSFPATLLTDGKLDNGITQRSPIIWSPNFVELCSTGYGSGLKFRVETPWSLFYIRFCFQYSGTFRVLAHLRFVSWCFRSYMHSCSLCYSLFSSPLSLFPLLLGMVDHCQFHTRLLYTTRSEGRRMGDVSAPQHSLIRPPVANEGERRNNHNRSNRVPEWPSTKFHRFWYIWQTTA